MAFIRIGKLVSTPRHTKSWRRSHFSRWPNQLRCLIVIRISTRMMMISSLILNLLHLSAATRLRAGKSQSNCQVPLPRRLHLALPLPQRQLARPLSRSSALVVGALVIAAQNCQDSQLSHRYPVARKTLHHRA